MCVLRFKKHLLYFQLRRSPSRDGVVLVHRLEDCLFDIIFPEPWNHTSAVDAFKLMRNVLGWM